MYSDRCLRLIDEALPLRLADQMQTLAQLQCRAETLGVELAAMKQRLTRDVLGPMDSEKADASPGATILIAEDQPSLGAIAEEMLEGLGYRVVHPDDERDDRIDAILLNVPFVSAVFLARVQQARQWSDRIVVTTLLPEGRGRDRLRKAGVCGFVGQPLEPRELRNCLLQVLHPRG